MSMSHCQENICWDRVGLSFCGFDVEFFWELQKLNCRFSQKDEVYLNLVLDYVPETVYRVARHFSKAKTVIPIIYVKVKQTA